MNAKSKYNAKDVIKDIDKKTKDFTIGESKVIYCIDTDQYERNNDHAKELNEISQYCEKNKYDLVWFCHDVEEVFWGQRISDSQKVQEAAKFRRKKKVEEIPADILSCDVKRACASNILNIFDKYLSRK